MTPPTPLSSPSIPAAKPRGIWRAPHLQDGYPVIIAVDSRGRCIASVTLHRGLSPSRVRRMLTECLDGADPMLHLKLVRDNA